MFDQYLTDLLHSTATKCHLPPIQGGQHHVFSAEHTTRDILLSWPGSGPQHAQCSQDNR